jgi:hypothetical protein
VDIIYIAIVYTIAALWFKNGKHLSIEWSIAF